MFCSYVPPSLYSPCLSAPFLQLKRHRLELPTVCLRTEWTGHIHNIIKTAGAKKWRAQRVRSWHTYTSAAGLPGVKSCSCLFLPIWHASVFYRVLFAFAQWLLKHTLPLYLHLLVAPSCSITLHRAPEWAFTAIVSELPSFSHVPLRGPSEGLWLIWSSSHSEW